MNMASSPKPIPSLIVSLVDKFLVDNPRHNLRRKLVLRAGKASSPLRFGVIPDDALDVAPMIASNDVFDLAAHVARSAVASTVLRKRQIKASSGTSESRKLGRKQGMEHSDIGKGTANTQSWR